MIKAALKRLPHPLLMRLDLQRCLRRQASLARVIAARTGFPLLEELDLSSVKTSDTCFVLGGGASINEISDHGWEIINRHDSFGLNLWPIHPFVPRILLFENVKWDEKFHPLFTAFQRIMQLRAEDYRNTVKIAAEWAPLGPRDLILEIPELFRSHLYIGYSAAVVARNEQELAVALRYLRQRRVFTPGRRLRWQFKYGSSVIAAMSLAVRMNYKRIVLCGIDLGNARYFYHDRERFPEACHWEFMPRTQPQVTAVRLEWRLPAAAAIQCFKREVLDPAGIQLFVENRASALYPEIPEQRAESLDSTNQVRASEDLPLHSPVVVPAFDSYHMDPAQRAAFVRVGAVNPGRLANEGPAVPADDGVQPQALLFASDSHSPTRNSRVIRVALFHPCLVHGGIPHVFTELAKGLMEQGVVVDMVQATPPPSGSATADLATGSLRLPDGVRQIDLNAGRVLSAIVPLVRYIRRERPDVIISGALHANIAAAWARRMARVPVRLILTEHSVISAVVQDADKLSTSTRTRMAPFFVRNFYPWADELVAVSKGTAADLSVVAGIPMENIHVIYNPVVGPELFARLTDAKSPPDHPWFVPGSPPVILAVGRLDHYKDYPTLLRAFAELRRNRPVRLLILGEGEERNALESLACTLGLGGADFSMPGNVENPLPFMKHSAVFALTSKTESFGLVLVEALAVGASIVATDCPHGPKEILLNGALGKLVPVGDVHAVADAFNKALDEPISAPPPAALDRFSRDESIRAYCRLLRIPYTEKANLPPFFARVSYRSTN